MARLLARLEEHLKVPVGLRRGVREGRPEVLHAEAVAGRGCGGGAKGIGEQTAAVGTCDRIKSPVTGLLQNAGLPFNKQAIEE